MCVGLLDKAKEDGGEDALNFYDNGCGYLLWCGKLTKQQTDFWSTMLRYCQNMEYDQEEVVDCIYFLLDEMQSNAALQQLRSEVAGVLTRLFFGQNYSVIKNCKENMEKVEMIRQFL